MGTGEIKYNCRHFIGEKPCKAKRVCEGCPEYRPMGFKILVIKLGAMGDVLRTTTILGALKKKYVDSHITWLVDERSYELLEHNPDIDKVLLFDFQSALKLQAEPFDLLINLEKIDPAIALAELVSAREKLGFGMNPQGTLRPLNPESLYAVRLGIDNQLKFIENDKSYQQIIFETLKLPYQKDEYSLTLDPNEIPVAGRLLSDHEINGQKPVLGICPGAGHVFANKGWLIPSYIELINRLTANLNVQVLLLGGEREKELCQTIREGLQVSVPDVGVNHSLKQFMAIVNQCDILITGDTLPMHIAIALKKKLLAIFGPTCHQEIELYGRGEKVVTKKECAPCYKSTCEITDNCMESISVDEVYEKTKKLVDECSFSG